MNKIFRARALWLAGLLALAPVSHSQTMEIYAGQGRFVDAPGNTVGMQPGAMAAAPDGYVYINDINGRLFRLNSATGLVTALPAIAGGLNHNLGWAQGLAIDPAGIAHIAAQAALHRINADGTLANLGSLAHSGPMAFAPDGTLYVIPGGDNRVYARRPSGLVELIAGGEEAGYAGDGGPAQAALFNGPEGLAVGPNGDIFISDTHNHRVRVISAATGIINTFAGNGTEAPPVLGVPASQSPLARPLGITFDAAGNLFAGAQNPYRILRIDAASQVLTSVAGTGVGGMSGDGGPASQARITWPRFLAVDPAGNVFFSDYGSQRHYIRRIDAVTGIITRALGMDGYSSCGVESTPASQQCITSANGMGFDPAGNLFVTDYVTRSIRKIAAGSRLMTTYKTVDSPHGLEIDSAGNLFYSNWTGLNEFVERIDAVTGVATRISSGSVISDIAIDPAGNAYLSDGNLRWVRRIDAATGASTIFVSQLYTHSLDFDLAGNLIASGNYIDCSLYRIDINTRAVTRIAGTGSCAHGDPAGGTAATATTLGNTGAFAVEQDGNILVAWSQRLFRIDMSTGIISRVNPPGGGFFTTPEGLGIGSPNSMELDAAGNLFISKNSAQGSILKISGLRDSTPPSITPQVTGTAGTGGWYRSDVQVSWIVTDGESSVTSSTGCSATSVSEDTAGITLTCSATSLGGIASHSVTVRRDTVAPTLSFGTATPEPNASGWNTGDVSVPFEAADALSGVYTTSSGSPASITGEGTGLTATVVVTDFAGNSITRQSPPVNIERAPPTVMPVVAGTVGNEGWYRSDIQVSWAITGNVISSSGCSSNSVVTDTPGVTFICSVTSGAGSASSTITVKRDATPPVLTWRAATPAPNAAGWNRANVSFPFNAPTDARSGVATVSAASPLVLSTEGTGVTGAVTVTDRAGNVAVFTTTPRNIDKTAPVVTIATPLHNKQYGLYATLNASFSCADAVSGTTNCSGTTENGATLNTRAMNGYYTFRVTSADAAGNSVTRSNAWTVAGSFLMEGFLAPMANDPTFNLVTAGTRVPMRFRLPDRNGGYVADTTAFESFTVATERCLSNVVTLNDVASGAAGLNFDAATSTYTYNWDTDASWAGTCRNIKLRLIDGSRHTLMFKFQ
jgi:sugar lactone lactonase YvrE